MEYPMALKCLSVLIINHQKLLATVQLGEKRNNKYIFIVSYTYTVSHYDDDSIFFYGFLFCEH